MANDFSGDSNCVALWRFESGALTADSIGGTNTLLDMNTVGINTIDFQEGSACADFELNNVEYFSIDDILLSADFPLKSGGANADISVCFWFRLESFDVTQYLLAKYIAAAGKRSFAITVQGADSSLSVLIGYNNGVEYEAIDHPGPVLAGRWYHVGVTWAASTRRIRIRLWDDTAQNIVGTDTDATALNSMSIGDAPVTIGARGDAGRPFDGLTDEGVVFNDILTAAEIDRIRQGIYAVGGEMIGTAILSSSFKPAAAGIFITAGPAVITAAGQNVAGTQSAWPTPSLLSWSGHTIKATTIISIIKAGLSWTGRNVAIAGEAVVTKMLKIIGSGFKKFIG